jgi:hypothetical protein
MIIHHQMILFLNGNKILYINKLNDTYFFGFFKNKDYENTIYFIVLSQNFHLLGLF